MSRRLLVPKRELWTPPRAEVKVHNHFLLELFNAKTGKKQFEAEAENVVTNSGRSRMADDGGYTSVGFHGACCVGIGSGAPAPTDVTMGANLKAVAGIATSTQVENPQQNSIVTNNWWRRHKFYFPELIANFTLTEVGIAGGTTASNNVHGPGGSGNTTTFLSVNQPLHTRALFRDANGSPISVTKTNTQIMVITATVFLTRGGVDSGMRLLDNYFVKSANEVTQSGSFSSSTWVLGSGSTAPQNSDVNLSGSQLAIKGGNSAASRNRVFWTADGWFFPGGANPSRPPEKPYVTAYSQDWELNEGNVTFSEVLLRLSSSAGQSNSNSDATVRLVFPCGTVAGTSVTKDNTVKMRQYLELSF